MKCLHKVVEVSMLWIFGIVKTLHQAADKCNNLWTLDAGSETSASRLRAVESDAILSINTALYSWGN
jgi:hypothetical protein